MMFRKGWRAAIVGKMVALVKRGKTFSWNSFEPTDQVVAEKRCGSANQWAS